MKTVFFGMEPLHATPIIATMGVVAAIAQILIYMIIYISVSVSVTVICVVLMCLLITDLIINIIFLVGAVQGVHVAMLPWIFIFAMKLFGVLFVYPVGSILSYISIHTILIFLLYALLYGFAVYCWLVVIAAYKQIGNEMNQAENGHVEFHNEVVPIITLSHQSKEKRGFNEAYNPMSSINLEEEKRVDV